MPSKNTVKIYVENGFYHIYNRGVEKRLIFQNRQDYTVFLGYLGEYLQFKDEKLFLKQISRPDLTPGERAKLVRSMSLNNFYLDIKMLAYCLMPNHFHFFVKQGQSGSIDKFMNSLFSRYVMYFNRKYKRVGPLFQDVYKAAIIDDEAYYAHLSRYIHKQALDAPLLDGRMEQPSSYPEYMGTRKTEWVHPEEILELFPGSNPSSDYARFVAEYQIQKAEPGEFFDEAN
jgi:putative transposase